MTQKLPQWLTEESLEEMLGWAPWIETTMSRVVAAYGFGLHDSYWAELRIDTALSGQALLAFRFCADWIKLPGAPDEWPLLLVRVPVVRSVTLDGYQASYDTWGHWERREISGAETHVGAGGIAETRIEGFEGETVVIEHGDDVTALCVWDSGEVLPLPELGP